MVEPSQGRQPGHRGSDKRFRLAVWVATGLGIGWVPWAPGTVGGAVWGLPLAYAIGRMPCAAQLVTLAILGAVAIPLCTAASRALGGKDDPGCIVLDEIVSMPITFLAVPMSSPWVVLAGFVLNRLLDIVKPPPARRLEDLPGGLGVMADDWAAGIYSCVILHLLSWGGLLSAAGR